MLQLINGHEDLSAFLKDDPVRPHIPMSWRVTQGREVYGLFEDQYAVEAPVNFEGPRAIICVAYTNGVALEERDLNNIEEPDTAMFYTVWSYDKGAGREIVLQTQKHIQETKKHIFRYVTLSPLTVMAERFHLRNGAHFIRKGKKCQNFEYPSQS
tara:strand:+ start:93 stop:557 length:465 start_codon:yes stop_codon:yes gene_type:complete